MDVEITSHLRVPRNRLDLDRVASDLWISNLDYETKRKIGLKLTARDYPGIQLWEEDGDYIVLPRGYDPPYRGCRPPLADHRPEFPKVEPRIWFRRKLWAKQEPAALSLIDGGRDKLLCLGCGKGKTTIACWYIAQRQVKTLIIVDRDFLVDQWKDEIKKNLWIPEHEVGLVQADSRVVGERITIAVINTLSQQSFPPDFFDQFGLVIVDECHMLGAPTFSTVLPCFPGERLLLSATPTRGDGMHPVFLYHGGGLAPCYVDLTRDQPSNWFFVRMPAIMSEEDERRCYRRMGRLKRKVRTKDRWGKTVTREEPVYAINRPIYESKAAESYLFNRLIVDEVMKAATSGRNVLVLGTRVEQLTMLASVVGEHADTGLVTGDIKGADRRAAFKRQVLFVTDRIGSRALDVPRLDTLMLLFPTKDADFLRQTVGRIDREHEGKGNPIAVVFAHPSLEKTQAEMRAAIRQVDDRAVIRDVQRHE